MTPLKVIQDDDSIEKGYMYMYVSLRKPYYM